MRLKTLYLDDEDAEKLSKEPNASELIRNLVKEHYRKNDLAKLSKEQLAELKQKVIAKNQLDKEIEDMVYGN